MKLANHKTTRTLALFGMALALLMSVLAPVAQAAPASNGRGGFGWIDLVVAVGVLAGIVLLGLYGDVVVGAMIFGLVALIEVAARLGARVVRRVAARQGRESTRPLAGTPGVSLEGQSQ